MKKYRLPLVCALIVLLSLALPFAVFSLWDRSLTAVPHSQTAGENLSEAGRANPTACLLYDCAHLLDLSLGYDFFGGTSWAESTMDADLLARTQTALQTLHRADLLSSADLANALTLCTGDDFSDWEVYTAPGGLTRVYCYRTTASAEGESSDYSYASVLLILTRDDIPLFFNYQGSTDNHSIDAAQLQSYLSLLGLDSFTDWQYPDWNNGVQNFGIAAYSESAQVYLTINGHAGLTLSAVSMTPQSYAEFDQRYTKGGTP